jgi:hypothetical protein
VKIILAIGASIFMAGCSVFGDSGVESAPYTVLSADKDAAIEVRMYDPMVLVSAPMRSDSGNSAFRLLFKYITGENEGATEIAMTAPVFMDENNKEGEQKGTEIAMTAPVFMDESSVNPIMSFVMPKNFTLDSTPKPTHPEVIVSQVTDYKVVAIEFNGTLSDSNVQKHTKLLQTWMSQNGYTAKSKPVNAGYNGPLTLPWWRKNEVIIEIN